MRITQLSRGDYWFSLLAGENTSHQGLCPSVKVADGQIDQQKARFIVVIPDAKNRYPRAIKGEVGLLEGWTLGKAVDELCKQEQNNSTDKKTAIIAIIDVPSQAYGRREEAMGIHQSLAAAAAAYAKARIAGHPVIGLIVGKAMSGAFLAHGYQANRLIAFNDPEVMIHAMGKEAAARITLRTVKELEKLASTIPPMAYDIENYNKLGLLHKLLTISNPDKASSVDIEQVKQAITEAIVDIRKHDVYLSCRLHAKDRQSSLNVRERMEAEW